MGDLAKEETLTMGKHATALDPREQIDLWAKDLNVGEQEVNPPGF